MSLSLETLVNYIEKNKDFIKKSEIIENDGDNENEKFIIPVLKLNQKTRFSSFQPDSNLDTIFSNYLDNNKIYYYGPIKTIDIPKNKNITLISSILYTLMYNDEEYKKNPEEFNTTFIQKLGAESSKKFTLNNYSNLGWNKKEFVENVKNISITKDMLRYITDYLYINLFIIDVEEDALIYVGTKNMVPFKKNIFLLKLKDDDNTLSNDKYIYHPFFSKKNNHSDIMRKIVNSKFLVEYLDCDFNSDYEDLSFDIKKEELDRYLDKIEDNSDNESNDDDIEDAFEESDIEDAENIEICKLADGITDKPDFSDNESSDDGDDNDIDTKFLVDDIDEDDDEEVLNCVVDKISVDNSYKVVDLKKIAKENGIKLSFTDKTGKKKNKNKKMLIEEINEI